MTAQPISPWTGSDHADVVKRAPSLLTMPDPDNLPPTIDIRNLLAIRHPEHPPSLHPARPDQA